MLLTQNDQRSFTIHATVTRAVLLSLRYNVDSMRALLILLQQLYSEDKKSDVD